jgi:N-glycosidase YbiA
MLGDGAILFYSRSEAYSEFSNFAAYGISLDGSWWPTVEHYYQAQKFDDPDYRKTIRRAKRAKDAKDLGLTRHLPVRADWELVKDGIMLKAVRAKFRAHEAIAQLLLSTGDRPLVENAPTDTYWGCGPDGTGLNKLGKILMQVREELRQS